MNNHQKLCMRRAVCFASLAAFTFGVCTGYFLWYAQFNFVFLAVCTGMVAVLIMCSTHIVENVVNFLHFGRVQARRNCNRTVRDARRDFVRQSK